jgi:lipoyl(octanoyl) transferase
VTAQLNIIQLGLQPYEAVWRAMRAYTDQRDATSEDQLWLLEHPPVFTLGQAAKPEHLLKPGDIPVIHTDRGGQVTYHGPGQLIVYLLIDLRRAHLGVRDLVSQLEQAVIRLLADYHIDAKANPTAPGVYIDNKKIASLGLRVRRGCSLHGLSLNVDMDLEPFQRINPCGYPGLTVTQLTQIGIRTDLSTVGMGLAQHLASGLGYTCHLIRSAVNMNVYAKGLVSAPSSGSTNE